ncbi:conserved hypothetical protein [Candidatus Magnetomoraceae bacterium gMMP-15]
MVSKKNNNVFTKIFVGCLLVALAAVIAWLLFKFQEPLIKTIESPTKDAGVTSTTSPSPFKRLNKRRSYSDRSPQDQAVPADQTERVIDYDKIKEGKNKDQADLMQKRKNLYGLNKSLDIIVNFDESIKIGDVTVAMKDIMDEIALADGEIIEDDIKPHSAASISPDNVIPDGGLQNGEALSILKKRPGYKPIYPKPSVVPEDISGLKAPLKKTQPVPSVDIVVPQSSSILSEKNKHEDSVISDKPLHDTDKNSSYKSEQFDEKDPIEEETIYDNQPSSLSERPSFAKGDERIYPSDNYSAGQKDKFAAQDKSKQSETQDKSEQPNFSESLTYDRYSSGWTEFPEESKTAKDSPRYFGIHVVRPGSNIWDIHFMVLKDYFGSKGIKISTVSDEPNGKGFSSGVGKILKFSEKIVNIYNLETKTINKDLNMIQPQSIVVVYNMSQVFDLLDQVDYSNVEHIQFDGETLWLPMENSSDF